MTYLRNSWYLAAWQDEIPGSGTVVRVILGDPVVLFRNENGEAKALLDRCPHRFAPLSSGVVADCILACAYHGLAFDGTGAFVVNPHRPVFQRMARRAIPTLQASTELWTGGG